MQQKADFSRFRLQRILATLWVGYCAYTMARRPWSVARADIQKETGLGTVETGHVDSAFLIMYTVGQMQFGSRVKGKASSRVILLSGLLGSIACCLVLGSTSSLPIFILAWGANGLFQAVGWASCMMLLTPWLGSAERGTVMGIWGTNMAAGGVAGNTLTSIVIAYTGSWRMGVFAVTCFLGFAAVVLYCFLGEHPNRDGYLSPQQIADGVALDDIAPSQRHPRTIDGEVQVPTNASGDGSKPSSGEQLSMMETLSIPGAFGICFSYFFNKLVRYALMFWLPYFFTKELGYTTVESGFIASVLDVGGVVGSLASGVFSDYYHSGQRRAESTVILIGGMALSLQMFTLGRPLLAQSSLWCSVAAFFVGVFSFGIDSLITGSLVQDFADRVGVPHHLGAISGVVGGIGTAGSILQGYVTATLSARSWETLYNALTLFTIIAAVLMYRPVMIERSQKKANGR